MLGIGLLSRQPRTDGGDEGGTCVGEVVESIGGDGDRAADQTDDKLENKKEQIAENTENPGKHRQTGAELR